MEEVEGLQGQYLLSYLGLRETVSCCSLFLKFFGHVPGEILGQVQHLFCSKAQQS